ncbi:hypothetical protein EHS25_010166 [Saitozyma podzolica]|uniref:Uncharacterized protein n=1 Tax=Saitozyma podzolica TaxID=1890683 RepID=A0A427YIU3_9TREE|nr:hypothetical protein EHS25_010166 [Saitozyma podzolica]
MDYLSILATRSLTLFPRVHTHHARTLSATSSPDTPLASTPHLVRPRPVSIPIQNILLSDTDLAYFLVQHVLSHQPLSHVSFSRGFHSPGNLHGSQEDGGMEGSPGEGHEGHGLGYFGPSPLSGYGKPFIVEAEVMVWKEIDKAKNFVRSLGTWFAGHTSMGEGDLKAMAETSGLGLRLGAGDHIEPDHAEEEVVLEHGRDSKHETQHDEISFPVELSHLPPHIHSYTPTPTHTHTYTRSQPPTLAHSVVDHSNGHHTELGLFA